MLTAVLDRVYSRLDRSLVVMSAVAAGYLRIFMIMPVRHLVQAKLHIAVGAGSVSTFTLLVCLETTERLSESIESLYILILRLVVLAKLGDVRLELFLVTVQQQRISHLLRAAEVLLDESQARYIVNIWQEGRSTRCLIGTASDKEQG